MVKFRSLTFFNFQFKWKNVSIKQILFTHNGVIGVDLSSSLIYLHACVPNSLISFNDNDERLITNKTATSVPAESLFSIMGIIIDDQRNRL